MRSFATLGLLVSATVINTAGETRLFCGCVDRSRSAWVTSSSIPFWRYLDDALVRAHGRITMSMLRFLFPVKGAPVSTSCLTPRPLSALDSACFKGSCMFTCAPSLVQVRACTVVMMLFSRPLWHPGHPDAKNSSTPRARLVACPNSFGGISRAWSVGAALNQACALFPWELLTLDKAISLARRFLWILFLRMGLLVWAEPPL